MRVGSTGWSQACQRREQQAKCRRGAAVIREDRELLAELARLNGDMAPLALRIMDDSASAAEQQNYAQRLIAAGEQLKRRADGMASVVIEGQVIGVIAQHLTSFPDHTVESRELSYDAHACPLTRPHYP